MRWPPQGAAKQPRGRFGKLTHESARPISRRGQYGARLTAGMPEVCSLRTDKRQIVLPIRTSLSLSFGSLTSVSAGRMADLITLAQPSRGSVPGAERLSAFLLS